MLRARGRVAICVATIVWAAAEARAAPNVLVSGNDQRILEYTAGGAPVRTVNMPDPDPARSPSALEHRARGTAVDERGRLHVLNGTFSPFLSSLDPATGTWAHRTQAGWSIFGNVSYGGIAAFTDYVFVPDMSTARDAAGGIIRFNLADNTVQQFEHTERDFYGFINLTRGPDGLLYGLATYGGSDGSVVRVYEPETMSFVREIVLGTPVRGIAVNAAGDLFGASFGGAVFRFTPGGAEADRLVIGGTFSDIDVALDGSIVVGSSGGAFYLTDASLESATRVPVPPYTSETLPFVTFAEPVPEPTSAGVVTCAAAACLLLRTRRR